MLFWHSGKDPAVWVSGAGWNYRNSMRLRRSEANQVLLCIVRLDVPLYIGAVKPVLTKSRIAQQKQPHFRRTLVVCNNSKTRFGLASFCYVFFVVGLP